VTFLDGLFLQSSMTQQFRDVDSGDVVDVDVAEQGRALPKALDGRLGVAQGENDGVADVLEADMGGDDVFHDAAATAVLFDPDAVVGAVAVAVEEADVADAAGFFTADGAHAVGHGRRGSGGR